VKLQTERLVYNILMTLPTPSTIQMLHKDFATTGNAIYANAFNRHNRHGIEPMFVGKPLNYVELHIGRDIFLGEIAQMAGNPIIREELTIVPCTDMPIDSGLRVSGTPGTATTYRGERCRDDIVLEFGSAIPPINVRLAVAGLWLAEKCLAYVDSDLFTAGHEARQEADYVGTNDWHEMGLKHRWRFALVPDLPLNGHEPNGFLMGYHTIMRRRANEIATEIKKARELNYHPWMVVRLESRYEEFTAAAARASSVINT
jgi:hypothetical protein